MGECKDLFSSKFGFGGQFLDYTTARMGSKNSMILPSANYGMANEQFQIILEDTMFLESRSTSVYGHGCTAEAV